ncbi:MAG: HAD family hydrolase [Actinomycetota bacterium]|nr:HAD family hydrolase [Actinomycetota bacterium]
MPSSAVIFDVDGTLVDTNYLHTLAWARGVREAGETISMSAIHRLIGMGSDQLVEELLGHESEEASDGHTRHFKKLMPEIEAFPGASDLLQEVGRRGAMVVLASSASEDELEAMLEAVAPPDDVIDHVTKKDDVENSKPSPDIFRVALDAIGLDPADVLVVGDTVWDIEAAAKCDLRFVGVLTGGISRQELEEAGAIAVYEDVAQLLRELDESPIAKLLDGPGGSRSG